MSDTDYDAKQALQLGHGYKAKISMPRNIKFHRKFFGLMKTVFDNQEQFDNMEYMRKEIIKAAGFYNSYFGIDGVEIIEAKSIKFGSMGEDEFSELYNRVLDVVVEHFGHDRQALRDEIEQFF